MLNICGRNEVRSFRFILRGNDNLRKSLPFELSREKTFFESLGDWMGDVLYDELPEKGFECRDEQIFMAYQIEQALKEKNVLFAEGLAEGKAESQREIAKNFLALGIDPATIAKATGLSEEEVRKL